MYPSKKNFIAEDLYACLQTNLRILGLTMELKRSVTCRAALYKERFRYPASG